MRDGPDSLEVQLMSKRIVVIGGGIVGSSIAFHLAQRDCEVTLIDRDSGPPEEASRASFAWMNARDKNPRAYHDLNRRSLDMWSRFAERLGEDVGLTWGGDVRWSTTEESARGSDERVATLQSWGYPARVLSLEEAESLAQGIRFEGFLTGSYSECDGHVDAVSVVRALHRSIEGLGGTIRLGEPVTGFEVGESIRSVETAAESYSCDTVVLAGGADAADIADLAGVPIPMYDTFGATVVTTPVPALFDGPSVLHGPPTDEIPVAIRQFADGTVVLHGGRHGKMHDESFGRTDEEARQLVETAGQVAPGLSDAGIVEVRRARRPIPQDGQSIVGYADDVSKLYLAVTHSGVTLAPLIGLCAAIEIVDGVEVDWLESFRLSRFGG